MASTSFIVSFIALTILIISKALQLRNGNTGFLPKLFSRSDVFFDGLIDWLYIKYSYCKKVVQLFFSDFIPSLIYEFLVKMKDYVAKRYYNTGNEFRGRRMLRSDGSVSSFLERLSEDSK